MEEWLLKPPQISEEDNLFRPLARRSIIVMNLRHEAVFLLHNGGPKYAGRWIGVGGWICVVMTNYRDVKEVVNYAAAMN
jgi:hypothetical protein